MIARRETDSRCIYGTRRLQQSVALYIHSIDDRIAWMMLDMRRLELQALT